MKRSAAELAESNLRKVIRGKELRALRIANLAKTISDPFVVCPGLAPTGCSCHAVLRKDMTGNLCAECTTVKRARDRRRYAGVVMERDSALTPCVDCGEDRYFHLEHAHEDRATKARAVTQCISFKRLRQELPKTKTRCTPCHRKMTFAEVAALAPKAIKSTSQRDRIARTRQFVFNYFKEEYSATCAMCHPRMKIADDDPHWKKSLVEWDHQGVGKDNYVTVARLVNTGQPLDRVMETLLQCKPLCRPHHRIVTKYRREVDPAYIVGQPLPEEWSKLYEKKINNHARQDGDGAANPR